MRHKLLQIANELNKHILHSDEEVRVEFQKFSDGEVGIFLFHHSDKYKRGCKHINFFEYHSIEEVQRNFEIAKDVIAGECLVDEADNYLLNQA